MLITDPTIIAEFEFATESTMNSDPWDCDIFSLMKDRVEKYNAWTVSKVGPEYKNINRRLATIDQLLREDFLYYCDWVPEIKALSDHVNFLQIEKHAPSASILIQDDKAEHATIGMSKSFLNFLHIFFSKLFTLTQQTKTSYLHEDFEELIEENKWEDDSLIISIVDDVIDFYSQDRHKVLSDYLYLHEPYDYCDAVIAARRFAMLHEVAHFHLKRIGGCKSEYEEELYADSLAFQWLLKPFEVSRGLKQYEKYSLAMHIRGALTYLIASFYQFAVHEWYEDKFKVFSRKKTSYRVNPLKREMWLIGDLWNHSVFKRWKDLTDTVFWYLSQDALVYDTLMFLTHRFGPLSIMARRLERKERGKAFDRLEWAAADAYYIYEPIDVSLAFWHSMSVDWFGEAYFKTHKDDKGKSVDGLNRFINLVRDRRKGLTRNLRSNIAIDSLHEQLVGFPAISFEYMLEHHKEDLLRRLLEENPGHERRKKHSHYDSDSGLNS